MLAANRQLQILSHTLISMNVKFIHRKSNPLSLMKIFIFNKYSAYLALLLTQHLLLFSGQLVRGTGRPEVDQGEHH